MSNNTAIKDYIEAQCDLAVAIKNATGFVNNDYADLNVLEMTKVNIFDYWNIIHATNSK